MKVFHCDHCGQLLFFENVTCMRCGRALAYVPEVRDVASLDANGDGTWRSPAAPFALRLCENYATRNVCNWTVRADDLNPLCRACRLTTTIPNLSKEGNDRLWYKLEVAKRRLVYTLDALELPVVNRETDPTGGLAFEFLEDEGPDKPVMTGHAGGVITVNLAEADDAERVKRRVALNEPYRTLLGHFRHESGHYYWTKLIENGPRIDRFRELFGDERASYQDALKRHYESPRTGWQDEFVSAYATMHPWEDWAETWAHYLHITDTLETASACGLRITPKRRDEPALQSVPNPADDATVKFDAIMDSWATITYVLNNLNRGLGNDDAYPFVITLAVAKKLRFVHETIGGLAA